MTPQGNQAAAIIALFCAMLFGSACQPTEEAVDALRVDTLIRNGQVFGGQADDRLTLKDVGIADGKIVFVGNAATAELLIDNEIDATGLIVTAGFIDPHTHSMSELENPDTSSNLNYLFQGVTTVFNGNDGGGDPDISKLATELTTTGIGTNTALFVGHGPVRRAVMGGDNREPTATELKSMQALVRQAMQDGALGFSTGLFYAPGSYSNTEEVVALAAAAAEYGGVYDTHLRDESSYSIGLLGAVEEALEIGKLADIPVHIAHIKALGADVWGQSEQVVELIDSARAAGQQVSADQYPWQASGTHLRNALLPRSVLEGDRDAYLQRLHDAELVADITAEVSENLRKRGGPEALLIVVADNPDVVGKTLAQVALERESGPVPTAFELMRGGSIRVASFVMNDFDIATFMTQEWVVTSSDGTDGHPRKYASFPKKYEEYVVNQELLTTEQFLYRSSALTAELFDLVDRGRIAVGLVADVIVLDPQTYQANANFKNWDSLSSGVVHAIVNGELAIHNSEYTGALAGQVLRKTADSK